MFFILLDRPDSAADVGVLYKGERGRRVPVFHVHMHDYAELAQLVAQTRLARARFQIAHVKRARTARVSGVDLNPIGLFLR